MRTKDSTVKVVIQSLRESLNKHRDVCPDMRTRGLYRLALKFDYWMQYRKSLIFAVLTIIRIVSNNPIPWLYVRVSHIPILVCPIRRIYISVNEKVL